MPSRIKGKPTPKKLILNRKKQVLNCYLCLMFYGTLFPLEEGVTLAFARSSMIHCVAGE